MRDTVVTGVGITKFGHFANTPAYVLTTEAVRKALADADLNWQDIQAAYCGCEDGGNACGHRALGELGQTGIPIVNIENACSSGASAFRLAYDAVTYGQYDTVLAIGFEKMPRGAIPSTAFYDWQLRMGFNFQPANYALETREYMHEVGITVDDISRVTVKNRRHGVLNPFARYQKAVTLEEVNESRMVASPFRLLHCSATSDGAVAIIITTKEKTKNPKRAVTVKASTLVCGAYGTSLPGCGVMGSVKFPPKENYVQVSARQAYEAAGLGPEDIDLLQAYDSMAAAEIWDVEDLGFCKKGEGARLIKEGYFSLGGKKPSNTDGGIMARGHAIGATGAAQIYEIVTQLRHEAGARQVANARVGLTHAMGAGPNSAVTILAKD